jgi:hypothetical protein
MAVQVLLQPFQELLSHTLVVVAAVVQTQEGLEVLVAGVMVIKIMPQQHQTLLVVQTQAEAAVAGLRQQAQTAAPALSS